MRKFVFILSILFMINSCVDITTKNPYGNNLSTLNISASVPEQPGVIFNGLEIKVSDINNGTEFIVAADGNGQGSIEITGGVYQVSASYAVGDDLFNASVRTYVRGKENNVALLLSPIFTGDIVFKEIYSGGCSKAPIEGEYQSDKYIMLHNNADRVVYLDSLCIGTLFPYNSNSSNPWGDIPEDYCPVAQAVWQIGGDGTSFPLEPGEDAVVVVNGAIDHSATFPESVNLNKEDYFVMYNATYFPMVTYHPAPGDKIRPERIVNVVIKTGQANAYTFSMSSPAAVIFRAKGTTIQDFVADAANNVIQVPGSSIDRTVKVPVDWIEDAVEVYDGRSSSNRKRFLSSLDAGYVSLSNVYLGHSLVRRVNERKSAEKGYEILVDTNNSSNDFYESGRQLLHQ